MLSSELTVVTWSSEKLYPVLTRASKSKKEKGPFELLSIQQQDQRCERMRGEKAKRSSEGERTLSTRRVRGIDRDGCRGEHGRDNRE